MAPATPPTKPAIKRPLFHSALRMANIGAAMSASDTEVIAIDTEKCVHQPKRMSPADKTRYDTSNQLANATTIAPRVSSF